MRRTSRTSRTTVPLLTAAVAWAAVAAPAVADAGAAAGADIHVTPADSIQQAIDAAPAGATVHLAPGTYRQDFTVTKPGLTVTGPRSAIVKGAGATRIISVQQDDVTLDGFTVDGLHGDPQQMSGYRKKLIYVMSTTAGDGVDGLTVTGMRLQNAGEECMRLRYLVTGADVSRNSVSHCGIYDFRFADGGKVGEAIYLGTAPEQQGANGAPDDRPDVSRDNRVHHNVIDSWGNECVDIKENSTANTVEHNTCAHQQDPESGGFDSRGSGNTFRYNTSRDNKGAGVRLGGDTPTDGTDNHVHGNVLTGNAGGGVKFEATPQGRVCGNTLAGNTGGDATGTYGALYAPGEHCAAPAGPGTGVLAKDAPRQAEACDYPAQQLDLTTWKITLPSGSAGSPTEILQPELATFADAPWFQVNAACTGVQFRAAVNGVTTSGSSYPRSELREMTNNGQDKASWSAASGTHTLTVREAFKKLPNDKPHVVGAQIHDGSDDVTVFRLEGSNLYVTKGDDPHHKLVTSNYQLNTVFEAKFVVSGGEIKAYYNGTLQTTIPHTAAGNYFKAGAYTQANCEKSAPCSDSNYGEVHIYDLDVSHS